MEDRTIYAMRSILRETENDPHLAVVMYSTNGQHGPWYDMVTGEPGYCDEVLDALIQAQEMSALRAKLEEAQEARHWLNEQVLNLRAELAMAESRLREVQ